jgi:hypothetical protein
VTAEHPLVAVLGDAVGGRFPKSDGGVEVLPPDADGTFAVVAFTGHAFVLTDADPLDVASRVGDGGFGGALAPSLLLWLAGSERGIGSIDVVLARPGAAGAGVDARLTTEHDEHPRVRRARAHRREVEVYGDDDGVVIAGRGLVDRRELSVELFDPESAPPGAGRRLIAAGLATVPAGEWCWAQVAPGNARSLRAFLACGFRPICAEVLIAS